MLPKRGVVEGLPRFAEPRLPGIDYVVTGEARQSCKGIMYSSEGVGVKWRAPSERIRTASEIPIEVELRDEASVPVYMKISEKVLHLRRLGMPYTSIAERLEVQPVDGEKSCSLGQGPE
jgi:hypothetical protein